MLAPKDGQIWTVLKFQFAQIDYHHLSADQVSSPWLK